MKQLVLIILFFLSLGVHAQDNSVPFTQADRDRLLRLEEKFEFLDQKIDRVEASLNTKIDRVETSLNEKILLLRDEVAFLANLIIALIIAMFGFTGYMIWDRKTTLNPVKKSQTELIALLREYAEEKNDETLKKILNKAAIF